MWNYMGWDNASTVAQEVEDPQHNYPRAMLGATALVAFTYILPLLAVGLAGLAPAAVLHRCLDRRRPHPRRPRSSRSPSSSAA
jgi:amino acid transporter